MTQNRGCSRCFGADFHGKSRRRWVPVSCLGLALLSWTSAASAFTGLTTYHRHRPCVQTPNIGPVSARASSRVFRPAPANLTSREKIEWALWTAWHSMGNPRPGSKEVRECLAFFQACQRQLGHKKLLVDAAGGHGGIACVFRAHRRTDRAGLLQFLWLSG